MTVIAALLFVTAKPPAARVTPSRVPTDSASTAPLAVVTVPPLIRPRLSVQVPVPLLAVSRASVVPTLFSVPVRFTAPAVPPVRLIVPMLAVVNVPPKFSVPEVRFVARVLVQPVPPN